MTNCLKIAYLILPLFILTLGMESCGSAQTANKEFMFEKNPPFEIANAYFQKWVAGTQEGGSGINVHLTLASVEPDVVIQDIYFHDHILEAKNTMNTPNSYVAHLTQNSKGDIIMDRNPLKEAENTPSETFPFKLEENQAVVSYWFSGKKNYFKINDLSEKREIAYPQKNPSN